MRAEKESDMKRRTFLRSVLACGATLSLSSRVLGANEDIRVGALGMGSFVKIGGRGRRDVSDFHSLPGVRVVAICDCDEDNLGYVVEQFKKRNERVNAYADFRALLDDKEVDVVTIATPNHWHSLMAIMACQAGKDVFVQKPASHNLFEGRKLVEAMHKYGRIVQATHGPRGSGAAAKAFQWARDGHLGKILCVYGINYRPRMSIGKVDGPQVIPEACNYDLWCGPAPKKPLMREHLHYDWHWDWDTGNGDLGNMGIHYMDACRWALGAEELPPRVLSIGGRFGYDDDGQTPNTLITLFDYEPAPIIFEVRGLPRGASYRQGDWQRNSSKSMDRFRGVRIGTLVVCEGGYVAIGSGLEAAAYDQEGRQFRTFDQQRSSTKQNFIDAVRNRKADQLYSDALQGHLSCGLVHMANISHRLGQGTRGEEIRESVQGDPELSESYARLEEHLAANRIGPAQTPVILGPALTLNTQLECFEGAFSDQANALVAREYRRPFVVHEKV
jgi:predicted dehydrogenase